MKRFGRLALASVLSLGILAAGCAGSGSGGSKFPEKPIEFIAPSGAGGGWDSTARTAAKVLNDDKIVTQPITVQNKAGGGGAVGLAYLVEKKGTAYTVNVYSPPLILIALTGQSQYTYKDTTPLAQVMTDYEVFAVKADSKFQSMKDVMAAAKADPKSVKVGGGSAPGSMDHLSFVKAAKMVGVAVKNIPYVSFQGGGEAMTALLGGNVDVIATGIGETVEQARAGKIRILGVTSPNRVAVIKDVPTLKEQGIDAEFIVWRGFFGPPNMPADAKKYFEDSFKKMLDTASWKDAAAKNGWITEYKNSADFTKFLDAENKSMESLLTELGLKQ
jgi:putative tricarboxylic transport membrane protein